MLCRCPGGGQQLGAGLSQVPVQCPGSEEGAAGGAHSRPAALPAQGAGALPSLGHHGGVLAQPDLPPQYCGHQGVWSLGLAPCQGSARLAWPAHPHQGLLSLWRGVQAAAGQDRRQAGGGRDQCAAWPDQRAAGDPRRPGHWSGLQPGAEGTRNLLARLGVTLYSPNAGQARVLEREGKDRELYPVPLVLVSDVVNHLAELLEMAKGPRRVGS